MKTLFMTPKRKRVLDYLKKFYKKNKYMPSVSEIAKHFKITISTAWEHLNNLENMGLIKKQKAKARAIVIHS